MDSHGSGAPEDHVNDSTRYRELFERVPVGLYQTTPEGRLLDVNPALIELFGYTDRTEFLRLNVADLYADPQERAARLATLESRGVVTGIEFRARRADGQIIWLRDNARAVRDASGQVTCYEGSLEDVTECRQAEAELQRHRQQLEKQVTERTAELSALNRRLEGQLAEHQRVAAALHESETRFRQLTDAINEVFFLISSDRVLYVSPRCEEVYGRSMNELNACPSAWLDFVHPEDRPAVEADLARQWRGEATEHEYRVLLPDGSLRWMRGRAFPIRDAQGQVYRVAGVATDVTAQRRSTELLRIQHDLVTALGSAPDVDTTLNHILDALLEVEELDAGGIYLLDEDTGRLRLACHRNLSDEFVEAADDLGPESPESALLAKMRPLYLRFAELDFVRDLAQRLGLRGLAVIPIRHEGRLEAVLNIASRQVADMPTELRHVIEAVADRLGAVIARARAEQARRESEALFRALAESTPTGIVIAQDDLLCYANPAVATTLGYSVSELVGLPFVELIVPEMRSLVTGRAARRVAGQPVPNRYESGALAKDGSRRVLEISAARIEYKRRPALMASVVDITNRKRAEEALRASEERYRLLAEYATDMISRVTPAGIWTYVSPACQSLLGCEPNELIGKSAYTVFHPEDLPFIREFHNQLMQNRAPSPITYRILRRDGRSVWVETTANARRSPQTGELTDIISVTRDASQRVEAEELARQHREQLAHVARVRTVGEMASGLAHELAQPLSATLYYARGCLTRLRDGTADLDDASTVLERIGVQVERAGEFIRRLKAFVRQAEPRRVPANINEIVRDTLAFAGPELRANAVNVGLELGDDLPQVQADPIQVEQVLLNLVRNAVEAINSASRSSRRVTVCTTRNGANRVSVQVKDTGPGLSVENQGRVFDPFFTTKSAGTGLGLTISRSIIEAHDGTLEGRPTADSGCVFEFTLPTTTGRP